MVHVGAYDSGVVQYKDEREVSPEKVDDLLMDLFDVSNYKSPIEVFVTDIQNQIEKQYDDEIYKAVVSIGVNVDKEELIRALKYDRQQYVAGLKAGMAAAKPEWIPVTERLPNLWETVIVCDTREQYVGACMYYGNNDWLHDDKLWDTSEITHWMPLPEPPNCGADMRGEEDV
jgi:hypothetical protein